MSNTNAVTSQPIASQDENKLMEKPGLRTTEQVPLTQQKLNVNRQLTQTKKGTDKNRPKATNQECCCVSCSDSCTDTVDVLCCFMFCRMLCN